MRLRPARLAKAVAPDGIEEALCACCLAYIVHAIMAAHLSKIVGATGKYLACADEIPISYECAIMWHLWRQQQEGYTAYLV